MIIINIQKIYLTLNSKYQLFGVASPGGTYLSLSTLSGGAVDLYWLGPIFVTIRYILASAGGGGGEFEGGI